MRDCIRKPNVCAFGLVGMLREKRGIHSRAEEKVKSYGRGLIAGLLCVTLVSYGQGNSFKRVRYNGGTIPSKVDPKDWDNHLTITSDVITLKLKDGVSVDIPTSKVSGLSYGQEAHRRVGTMIALAILVAPVALFGLFHKTRLHFIGIDYDDAQGKHCGILLQGDKENYRAILQALASSTGQSVAVAEKDREYVPTQVKTTVVKGHDEEPSSGTTSAQKLGTVVVESNPPNADVYLDSAFVGNAPATLKVPSGKHTIRVALNGYKEWSKEISILGDSEVKLVANLERKIEGGQGAKDSVSPDLEVKVREAPVETTKDTLGTNSLTQRTSSETIAATTSQVPTSVTITSAPVGGEVYADDSFVGKSPVTINLNPGRHFIRVFMNGYRNWSRQVNVDASKEVNLLVTLEKSD